MKTENSRTFTSTLSINPYENHYIKSVSSFLSQTNNPEYSKEQYVLSYLNTQEYINNQIEISSNIPDEDIHDAISIKVYDELGLDQAIEYQIQYIETFNNLNSENRVFQVFLVDPASLDTLFNESLSKIKYIDSITPAPLLIKSLYSKELIQESGIHAFIYFENSDAFIAIYNEQEFIYNKSLKYSFVDIHDRFCELYGEQVPYEDFIDFLLNENLKHTKNEYKSYLLKLYQEIFSSINDILTYAKKAFEIEKISHIYVGSQLNLASKLYEIAEVELGIESSDFDFAYDFETSGLYVNQMHSLMQLTAILSEDEKYSCNFSTFNRPPKFRERESGKIILLSLISVIIAFSYPVTFWILTYLQELQYESLQKEYNVVHTEKINRQTTIKIKEAEKEKVTKLLNEEKEIFISKKNTLLKIHDVKVNYPMKAKLISNFIKDLNTYYVKVNKISYSENEKMKFFTLTIASKKDKQITKLLKYLTEKYDRKFEFFLENINYNEEKKLYLSELKVKIL